MHDVRTTPRAVLLMLIMLTAIIATGCDRLAPTAGPVRLRGVEHMNEFLVGLDGWEAWELRGVDSVRQLWLFRGDGTFRVWIEPGENVPTLAAIIGVPAVPAEATSITGTWRATIDTLELTRLQSNTEATVADTEVPLRWIDGKLRIGIADQTYMRAERMELDLE